MVSTSGMISARSYQLELAEYVKTKNLIIALGTGAGKTYIAVMAAQNRAAEVVGSLSKGAKRIVFLAPTRVLVHQQAGYLENHTQYRIGKYTGEDNVDTWKSTRWEREFEENHVLVMTFQVFGDILSHKYFSMSKVSLLVIDECHSAVKDSPLMQVSFNEFRPSDDYCTVGSICRIVKVRIIDGLTSTWNQVLKYRDQCVPGTAPRILGLTACLINKDVKVRKLKDEIQELENNIGGKAVTGSDVELIRKHATKATVEKVLFEPVGALDDMSTKLDQLLDHMLVRFDQFPAKLGSESAEANPAKDSKKILKDCQTLLRLTGILGLFYHVESSFFIVDKLRLSAYTASQTKCLDILTVILTNISDVLKKLLDGVPSTVRVATYTSPKVGKLLEILRRYKDSSGNFRGLIFVEQKVVSKVLQMIIQEAASCYSDLTFVKPLYIIGG